jgi:hypothetical protein
MKMTVLPPLRKCNLLRRNTQVSRHAKGGEFPDQLSAVSGSEDCAPRTYLRVVPADASLRPHTSSWLDA